VTAALALVPQDAGEASAVLLAAFRRHLEAAGRRPRTIASYEAYALALAAHAETPLDEITNSQVEAFLAAERARVKARGRDGGATAAAAFRSLRALFTWAESRELVDRSPMRGVDEPAVDQKVIRVPATADLKTLLASMAGKSFADRRDTAIVRLMCELGGPRRAEVAGIRVQDLDLRRGIVLLHGKGGTERLLPFGATTSEALMRYLAVRKRQPRAASPMLWLGDHRGKGRGGPLTGDGIMQLLARRSEAAGVGHLHPHMLRHFAAAQAKRNRVPTAQAKALFGWKTSQMYEGVYARFSDAETACDMARQLALGDQL
jgi:site-specific recombinase XerD